MTTASPAAYGCDRCQIVKPLGGHETEWLTCLGCHRFVCQSCVAEGTASCQSCAAGRRYPWTSRRSGLRVARRALLQHERLVASVAADPSSSPVTQGMHRSIVSLQLDSLGRSARHALASAPPRYAGQRDEVAAELERSERAWARVSAAELVPVDARSLRITARTVLIAVGLVALFLATAAYAVLA